MTKGITIRDIVSQKREIDYDSILPSHNTIVLMSGKVAKIEKRGLEWLVTNKMAHRTHKFKSSTWAAKKYMQIVGNYERD